MTPLDIHDRFWDAQGVSVIRCGSVAEPAADAELFLLMRERSMAIFDAVAAAEHLHWANCELLPIRIRVGAGGSPPVDERLPGDSPRPGGPTWHGAPRVAVTSNRDVAVAWAFGGSTWRRLRANVPQCRRGALSLKGFHSDIVAPPEAVNMVGKIAARWDRPDQFIGRARRVAPRVWMDAGSALDPAPRRRGCTAWLGAGHASVTDIPSDETVVLWDICSPKSGSEPETGADRADQACGSIVN